MPGRSRPPIPTALPTLFQTLPDLVFLGPELDILSPENENARVRLVTSSSSSSPPGHSSLKVALVGSVDGPESVFVSSMLIWWLICSSSVKAEGAYWYMLFASEDRACMAGG
jgi:hypothetical protein